MKSHPKPADIFSEKYTEKDFEKQIESGAYAFPGGYPLFFVTNDGAALCFEAAKENRKLIAESIKEKSTDGWQVIACIINWEDDQLHCDHTGQKIDSAY